MGTNEKDMTAGSPGKLIITFAIPMMLGNIFQQFYTMAGVGDHDRYHTGFFYSCISVLWSKGKGKSEMCSSEKLYHDSITVCGRTRSK